MGPISSLSGFYSHPPSTSSQIQGMYGRSLAFQLNQPDPDKDHYCPQDETREAVLPSEVTFLHISAQTILEQYKKAVEKEEREDLVLKLGLEGGGDLMKVGLAYATGPAAGIAGIGVDVAIDKAKNFLLDKRNQAARKKLALDLSDYRNQNNNFDKFVSETNESTKGVDRYKLLYGEGHPALDPAFDNFPEEVRGLIQGTQVKVLADGEKILDQRQKRMWDILADEGDALKAELTEQGKDLHESKRELEREILSIDSTFTDFAEDTGKQMNDIHNSVEKINNRLDSISTRVEDQSALIEGHSAEITIHSQAIMKNQADVSYLQSFLFDKMNPEEQISALQAGFFNIPEEERKQLQDKIETINDRQELVQNLSNYAQGGQQLLMIAKNFGVNVPPDVDKTVNDISGAITVGVDLYTGNYMGALLTVSQLFGTNKKQEDVGAARHRQVMEGLGKLAEGESKILNDTHSLLNASAALLKGQDELLNGQRAIYAKLNTISTQINQIMDSQRQTLDILQAVNDKLDQQHSEVMRQLARISAQVTQLRLMLQGQEREDVYRCESALRLMYSFEKYIPRLNRFVDYNALIKFYDISTVRDHIRVGLNALNAKIPLPGLNDLNFLVMEVPDLLRINGELISDINQVNLDKDLEIPEDSQRRTLKFYQLLWLILKQEGNLELALAALILPVASIEALKKKIISLEPKKSQERLPKRLYETLHPPPGLLYPEIAELLGSLYCLGNLKQFVEYVFRFHYMFPLFKKGVAGEDLLTMEEIESTDFSSTNLGVQSLLQQTLCRIDIALAQQALLTGDFILDKLVKKYIDGYYGVNRNLYTIIGWLLDSNPVLARNFIMYAAREEVVKKDSAFILYSMAYNDFSSPRSLQELIGYHWKLKSDSTKKEWFIEMGVYAGDKALKLPNPDDLQKGQLESTPEVRELLDLHAKIAGEIVGYSFTDTLGSAVYNDTYLRSLILA